MNTYYFSMLAVNHSRKLEVRRCIAIEATHYDAAERELVERHLFMIDSNWQFSFVDITDVHYEALCGILEVSA